MLTTGKYGCSLCSSWNVPIDLTFFKVKALGEKDSMLSHKRTDPLPGPQFPLCKMGWGVDGLSALTCQEWKNRSLSPGNRKCPEIRNSWARGGVFLQEFLWTDISCPATVCVWTRVCQRPAELILEAQPRIPHERAQAGSHCLLQDAAVSYEKTNKNP